MSEKAQKKQKYEDRIMNELNLILRRDLNDSRLQFASITKVELSYDFGKADVYWDTFDSSKRGDVKKAIESALSKMRSLLSQTLKVRSIPELSLVYDSQYEDEQVISKLLNEESKSGRSF